MQNYYMQLEEVAARFGVTPDVVLALVETEGFPKPRRPGLLFHGPSVDDWWRGCDHQGPGGASYLRERLAMRR
jgi:hypothetical protein